MVEPSESKKMPSSGYTSKVRVEDRYNVVGFIRYVSYVAGNAHVLNILKFFANGSSGTYGRVYKAIGCNGQSGEFAIKK